MGGIRDATALLFSNGGLDAFPGYRPRLRQTSMALAVAGAMEDSGIHLFEAGTGVGKSLAYLVPAMLSGRRVFVSTATRTLQDQLSGRDLPWLCRVLGYSPVRAVLKGRGNYLCLKKLERLLGVAEAAGIASWASATRTGDVSELPGEPDPSIWARLRSDASDCLAGRCQRRGECHFLRARAEARKAIILILNHHLLVSALSAEELLPEAEILIADEGHRLEDAAADCLGWSISPGGILPVFDCIAFSSIDPDRKAGLLQQARDLSGLIERLVAAGSEGSAPEADLLMLVADCASSLASATEDDEDLLQASRCAGSAADAARGILGADPMEYCVFLEGAGRSSRLRAVPLDLGGSLRESVYSRFDCCIMTSATLTVAGSFDYSAGRLGARDAASAIDFGSPFDFGAQAVLLVPEDLPEPDDHQGLIDIAWKWISTLAGTLGGRTLALFTSNRNLGLASDAAVSRPIPGVRVLVQGQQSRGAMLDSFRSDPSAVMLGTATFWEGVDLPRSMLQAVVIDRLPFPSPGHPLTAARLERIAREGGNPFRELTLPSAVIRLRQGVGRLLRSEEDRGVVVLLDRRVRTASYGSLILRSLPAFRPVDEREAMEFASRCAGERCAP